MGYDDSLDAFGVHGVGGTLGALLTGIFATSAINPVFKDAAGNALPVGVIEGHWGQLGNQIVGILIAIVLSVVGTLVIAEAGRSRHRAAHVARGRDGRHGRDAARRRGIRLGLGSPEEQACRRLKRSFSRRGWTL